MAGSLMLCTSVSSIKEHMVISFEIYLQFADNAEFPSVLFLFFLKSEKLKNSLLVRI